MIIAGVDEAGRGALAGPVVAGAVVLGNKKDAILKRIKDSKVMTDQDRRDCYKWLIDNVDYGVGIVSAAEIDAIGIKKATEKAMNLAVASLKTKNIEKLQIDGRDGFQFPIASEDIVGGDGKILEISAASIIAKVTRDDLMLDLDQQYSEYGFAGHKGYGAAEHMKLLRSGNYCAEHRKTYDPLKTWLNQSNFGF